MFNSPVASGHPFRHFELPSGRYLPKAGPGGPAKTDYQTAETAVRTGTVVGAADIAFGWCRTGSNGLFNERPIQPRGKTHLLCAIGQELIQQGYWVLYIPCSLLVQNLLIAKRDLNLQQLLKRLAKYSALIIDDIGYVQQSREEMEVLFTLLADRYERGSVMITSNLPFSNWEKIFKDPMTTAAAIDRLVHHSIILELNLPSYRLEQSKKKIIKKTTP